MEIKKSFLNAISLMFYLFNIANQFDIRSDLFKPWKIHMNNKINLTSKLDESKKLMQNSTTNSLFLQFIKTEKQKIKLLKTFPPPKIKDYKEFFIKLKIDHYSFANENTFNLRYLVKDKYFNPSTGKKAPIFFYCGNEGPIELFWNNSGFITETLAKEFNALVIFAEHRFFGESFPFGGVQDYNITKNQYLTVEQALADYIELLEDYRNNNNLNYIDNPIIAFGGSYGGMLAAWGRMKFPHIYSGAIASSAPILFFGNKDKLKNNFFKIATDTYKRYSEDCPQDIRKGFDTLNKIRKGQFGNVFSEVNSIFNLCTQITNFTEVKMLKKTIKEAIVALSQYNYPYETSFIKPLPGDPVKVACEKIRTFKTKILGEKPYYNVIQNPDLSGLMRGSKLYNVAQFNQMEPNVKASINYLKLAADLYYNYTGTQTCLEIGNSPIQKPPNGIFFLACTELVMPKEQNGVTDMFNPKKWDLKKYIKKCKEKWHADVRPNWIFDYFGGRHFKKEMKNYSKILFTNGLMDPWYAGSPKESTNPEIYVVESDSGHHQDIRLPNEKDQISVIEVRNLMRELIKKWIE